MSLGAGIKLENKWGLSLILTIGYVFEDEKNTFFFSKFRIEDYSNLPIPMIIIILITYINL